MTLYCLPLVSRVSKSNCGENLRAGRKPQTRIVDLKDLEVHPLFLTEEVCCCFRLSGALDYGLQLAYFHCHTGTTISVRLPNPRPKHKDLIPSHLCLFSSMLTQPENSPFCSSSKPPTPHYSYPNLSSFCLLLHLFSFYFGSPIN